MARFTTIRTRYAGTCVRCKGDVPVGTRVRYGYGRVYHMARECPGSDGGAARSEYDLDRALEDQFDMSPRGQELQAESFAERF